MLSPVIDEHVYDCSRFVLVSSIAAGSKVAILSRQMKIGAGEARGGLLRLDLDRELHEGEELTAVAQIGNQMSSPSAPVSVKALPSPIAAPVSETIMYEGGTCVGFWGVVPGSTVRAWSAGNLLGEGIAYDSWGVVFLQRPLTQNDSVQLNATMCEQQSDKTGAIVPVFPHGSGPFAEKLPPPTVLGPLFPCQDVVGLKGLMLGSHFQVFNKSQGQTDPGSIVFDHCADRTNLGVLLGKTLQEDDEVRARQSFEALGLESDYSRSVWASHYYYVGHLSTTQLNAPRIGSPIIEGERAVFVFHLVNSATVEIAVDGISRGESDYEGKNKFDLGLQLSSGQSVKARQGLCGVWSPWSGEVRVGGFTGDVAAPVLEELHYSCATMVRTIGKLEGSIIEVYVDGIFAGEHKSRVVPVVPHLRAGQTVTAFQRMGTRRSNESLPIIVKEVQDQPPPPILHSDDPRFVEASNLLPGARVNVLWNTLLIASKEAIDTNERLELATEPWYGEKIHSNQSICMKKSADSNAVTVFGKIVIETTTGSSLGSSWIGGAEALVDDVLTVTVRSEWPVKADVKVRLISSDPNIANVQGSGEATISAGNDQTSFSVRAVSTGVVYLELSADHYKQTYGGFFFEQDNRYELGVYGVLDINPKMTTIEAGRSFQLTASAHPVPADRKIILVPFAGGFEELVVTIPANSTSVTKEFTAPLYEHASNVEIYAQRTSTSQTRDPDDRMVTRSGSVPVYRSCKCTVSVTPKQAESPVDQPPLPTKMTQGITLSETLCADYEQKSPLPVLGAKLVNVKNLTNHRLHIYRYVGGNPPGEPKLDIYLDPSKDLNTSLQSQDLMNGWGVSIDEDIQCVDAPSSVGLLITFKL